MKKIITICFFISIIAHLQLSAQQKAATILKSPTDWGFERMDFPLGFAPGIKFTGFEEIRFAPGMMDTTKSDYFTYAFVVSIDGQKNLNLSDIKDFLNTGVRLINPMNLFEAS